MQFAADTGQFHGHITGRQARDGGDLPGGTFFEPQQDQRPVEPAQA